MRSSSHPTTAKRSITAIIGLYRQGHDNRVLTAFRSVGTGHCRVLTYLESADKIYDVRSQLKECRQLGNNMKNTNK